MTMEPIYITVTLYIITLVVGVGGVIYSRKRGKRSPIESAPKVFNPIIGESKSEMLTAPPPKPNPAQIPKEAVDDLFDKNPPLTVKFDEEYADEETIHEYPIPLSEEVAEELVGNQCIDYMEMEATVNRMVRGGLTPQDQPILERLEGTDIYNQIEQIMGTSNLELVRSILNR